jgi:hypothetical protein
VKFQKTEISQNIINAIKVNILVIVNLNEAVNLNHKSSTIAFQKTVDEPNAKAANKA